MTTARLMQITLLALTPGALAMTFWWGPGVLVNLIVAATLCALLERGYAKLRRLPMPSGGYGAAILAGCLLALCLPPYVPINVLIIGVIAGLVLGKYVYGGLGNNPFNPALVGYCFIMISFPAELTFWMHPTDSHWDWQSVFAAKMFASTVDGYSGATLLDAFRHRGALTVEEVLGVTSLFDRPHTLINMGFLAGGLVLLALRIIRYQAPLGFLLGLALPALFFFDSGSSQSLGSPIFHLLSGGTMLAAFFIVTDPVSGPDRPHSQFWFGLIAGGLTFLLRSYSAYPDGIAFAILIANIFGPLLDTLLDKPHRSEAST